MAEEPFAGRYRLLEPLGQGPMSSVWLAHDDELEREVAVKMLGPTADRARFEREARAAAALSHPHICSLYDYGEAGGKPYMVLEYLPGGSLEERLRDGKPLPDAETTRIATEIASGLAHAHERGLVHRDLKPANILFDAEQRAKIADFGIARLGDSGTFTEAGTVLGTASYISPEQAAGLPAGPASDVYSFAVILFRMLSGRLPFVAANAMEVVRMHRDDPPPAVKDLRSDAPARLSSIVSAALEKDPAGRPADGAALLRELRGEKSTATRVLAPGTFPQPAASDVTQVIGASPKSPRRGRGPLVLFGALALALLGGGVALALLVLDDGGSSPVVSSTPSLGLPSVPSVSTVGSTTLPTTTAETTTASTTAPTTTAQTTTAAATTAPTTTAQTTTAAATTAPTTTATTTAAATTTAPTTTADTTTTTDTGATTTTLP